MARDEGVSKTTMWRLCREDLGMIPYKKTAPASPIGGHQGAFKARRSNPENLARWHDAADLVDGRKPFHLGGRAQHPQ